MLCCQKYSSSKLTTFFFQFHDSKPQMEISAIYAQSCSFIYIDYMKYWCENTLASMFHCLSKWSRSYLYILQPNTIEYVYICGIHSCCCQHPKTLLSNFTEVTASTCIVALSKTQLVTILDLTYMHSHKCTVSEFDLCMEWSWNCGGCIFKQT